MATPYSFIVQDAFILQFATAHASAVVVVLVVVEVVVVVVNSLHV